MKLRRVSRKGGSEEAESRGFDSFELRLGDLMRGERATMGKSLLDVERELRIKASYVAAIENCDPDAFDTPGFIPGYVRSYARYLEMDPDRAFATFCAESGFSIAHGMSAAASSVRKADEPIAQDRSARRGDDRLVSPNTPFIPASESVLSRIEPGAIGSISVLLLLIGAIGYGGWSVLNEVQRVKVVPVEYTPDVLADLDPLDDAARSPAGGDMQDGGTGNFAAPADDTLDRLYRPEALDVPVLVARDGPISTLDPARVGTFSPPTPAPQLDDGSSAIEAAVAAVMAPQAGGQQSATTPQVMVPSAPGVQMVAVRPAWVRVRAADGSVIFEGIMNAGDTYDVPGTETPPTLRVGESGAIYFRVNGQHYGPAGPRGSVTSNLALASEALTDTLELADISQDSDLKRYVAELQAVPQQ